MKTLTIEVLNPEGLKLLEQMEVHKLIAVKDSAEEARKELEAMLEKFRAIEPTPTEEEIVEEVEQVRKERYEKHK